jgi:hypothetical protein
MVWPPSSQTNTFSGRSSAASGAAAITGVPAAGLPKITTFVSRRSSPAALASPLWSITANSLTPFDSSSCTMSETVSSTDTGLVFDVITSRSC